MMTGRASHQAVRCFVDDDAGYLRWIDAHPDGFVINTYRKPNASYLMLHKARCWTIRGDKRWTGDYIKICSESPDDLREWALREVGGTPSPCGHCGP